MSVLIILALCLAAVSGQPQRIVGGTLTTIAQYPQMTSLLTSYDLQAYWQHCGGTILNEIYILTAAHCTDQYQPANVRARVGSTYANSGGTVYAIGAIVRHPSYNSQNYDSDVAIIRTTAFMAFNNLVQPASIAHNNYNVPDNQIVWVAGWGATSFGGPSSEQLRHVQIYSVNQSTCRNNYATRGFAITDNMLCSGYLGVGGRDACSQDSGGPVYHNGIVVGITSFGLECGDPWFPGVNTRVSRYTSWIVQVAQG